MAEPWTDEDAEFWDLIVRPDGEWDIEQIKRELGDYRRFMHEVSIAYCELTHSRISKPNTLASAVVSQHDEVCANGAPESECPKCGLDHPWACVECGQTL